MKRSQRSVFYTFLILLYSRASASHTSVSSGTLWPAPSVDLFAANEVIFVTGELIKKPPQTGWLTVSLMCLSDRCTPPPPPHTRVHLGSLPEQRRRIGRRLGELVKGIMNEGKRAPADREGSMLVVAVGERCEEGLQSLEKERVDSEGAQGPEDKAGGRYRGREDGLA